MAILFAAAFAAGCEKTETLHTAGYHDVNASMIDMFAANEIEAAVIRQHTIFPHHFEQQSAALNEHGRVDLAVLARHFADHPGSMNVAKGGADSQLYEARVQHVLDALALHGIPREDVRIADDPAGGAGIAGRNVKIIFAVELLDKGVPPDAVRMTSPNLESGGADQ